MAATDAKLQLGRYQLYKQGTKKIVEWLTQTASRFINISPFSTPEKTKKAGSKIKARALISLAEVVASAQGTHVSRTAVPLDTTTVVELVREVIDGRQPSAEWYDTQPASAEAQSANEAHKFFIGILRHVHRILESIKLPEKMSDSANDKSKANKKHASKKHPGNDLNNLFLQLELEEPTESPLGKPPPSSAASTSRHSPTRVSLEKTETENAAFALWCHLEDMRDVRCYVQDIWLEYSNGDVSLLTATMLTETAFGLMRIADERFVEMYKAFDDWSHLAKFLSIQLANSGEWKALHSPKIPSGSNPSIVAPMDLMSLVHPTAVHNLQELAVDINGILAKYATKTPFAAQQFVVPECYDFSYILRNSTVELAAMVALNREDPGQIPAYQARQSHLRTEFVMNIHCYIVNGRLPLWLVFAYQVYSDLYLVIGSDPWCASEEYLNKMDKMEAQICAFKPWRAKFLKMKPGLWPAVDEVLKSKKLNQPLMRVSEETMKLLGQHVRGNLDDADLRSHMGKPMRSLIGMPCWAGKELHQAKVFIHYAGVENMNQQAVFLAMAHLYTAARRYSLVSVWQDMELVLAQQNKANRPLVPKQSKNVDAYAPLRHYLLCLGVPAIEFAHGRIPKLPGDVDIANKCRQVSVTSAYMNALLEGQTRLMRLGFSRGDLNENILDHLTSIADGKLPKGKGGEFSTQHSLLRLLSTYKAELIKDEPFLNFNYLGLWMSCRVLLGDVARALDMVDPKSTEATGDDFKPWAMVYRLLDDAATATSQSKSLIHSKMGIAARLMEKVISAQGNKFSLDAFNQSSGRIPKNLRPFLLPRAEP